MSIVSKFLTTLKSVETKQVEVAQTWEVRWRSRQGEYHHDTRPELESFLSEEDAYEFAKALRLAYKLTRSIGANSIRVEKST